MNKIVVLVLAACVYADDSNSASTGEVGRQKRLLFFDEGGSLVKTYSNPYMNRLSENGQNLPYYGNFLNPFFNFIRHFGNSLIAYTIPVSDAIIQSIKLDPSFQNTLVVIPKKDPIVAPNPLCEGKRTQIPAPNWCNNFLNCWDGWAFEQECPSGLMFSSNGYCDYADNVDCNNRKLDVPKPQPQPVCSKDFEAFRNQKNCHEFFVCVNRQPVRFQCPENLAYSQILGVCDYADRVDCTSTGGSLAPSLQPAYPTPPSPTRPIIPPSQAVSADSPIPQEIPMVPASPVIPPASPVKPPASPMIPPASPVMPPASSVIPPASPMIPPTSPVIPPALSVIPPALPSTPPQSPVIPPAPAAIPPLPSLLPPGSFYPPPASVSQIYPSQRPMPPAGVFPAPVPEGPLNPGEDKPALPDKIIFTPGCSSVNVAMSRQDAIHLLQQAISTNIAY